MSNYALTKDESVIKEGSFMQSALLFFLKSNFVLTNKRLLGTYTNTFFIFPVGKNNVTYPLNNIAGVRLDTKTNIVLLIFGALLALGGIISLKASGIVSIVLGILLILASIKTIIVIQNTGGASMSHAIAPMDKAAANEFIQAVNNAIVEKQ